MKKICLACSLMLLAQIALGQKSVRIATWNVENLFDTQHDSLKNDTEFLPNGDRRWSNHRYWTKLNAVAQTIVAIGGEQWPTLVALQEVENDTVMRDLTTRSMLRAAGYKYVMTHCADRRGVDVALLYQPMLMRLLAWHPIRIPSSAHGYRPTRDLLYAKGRLLRGDTLHIIVCHLPSKAGGVAGSEGHRRLAATTLRSVVDSLLLLQPDAKLAVLGDFNAAQREAVFDCLIPPLRETLPTSRRSLRQPRGTYNYRGRWSYLDHILLSEALRQGVGGQVKAEELRRSFLLDKQGKPFRTYRGPVYQGGVSDHLPLFVDLTFSPL